MKTQISNNLISHEKIITDNASASLYFGASYAALGNVEIIANESNANGRNAASHLLNHAVKIARASGQPKLIAPLNGDTWHAYRTIIESSDQPKFFLEPDSPLSAKLLLDTNFELIAQYSSSLIDLTASIGAISAAVGKREKAIESGFEIRHLNSNNFNEELKDIFSLSLSAFRNNFLYQAISFKNFAELYQPIKAYLEDRLIWLAYNQSQLVGLLFAIPDPLNQGQIILKSVAVHPQFEGLGIASYLLGRAHSEAIKLGFTHSIQALYKDENRSAALTAGLVAKVIRRYGIFALDLTA
jgi:GNAT superfamily N-acetyltransferase